MKNGGELDKYQKKGEVKSTFNLYQKTTPIIDRGNFAQHYTKPIVQNVWINPKTGLPMTKDEAEMSKAQQIAKNQNPGSIRKTVPVSAGRRALDIVSNPMTAAQQAIAKQPITGRGPRNILDNAVDFVNPITYARAIKNTTSNVVHPIETLKKLGNAGLGTLQYITEGNTNIPVGEGYGVLFDGLMTAGALKNIPKINPWKYKKIEVPIKNFKSEIDWENWIKYKEDFHNNPEVIKHLIDIEKTTKANGTWMKNPDGSPFEGTPEQFVVQQSDNFKNAFEQGIIKNEKNVPRINYHYSDKEFDVFDEAFFRQGRHGKGIYTGLNPNLLNKRSIVRGGDLPPTNFTKRYSLYQKSTNPQTSYNDVYDKLAENHKNIQKIYSIPFGKKIYNKKLKNLIEENDKLHKQTLAINPETNQFDIEHAIHTLKDNYTSLDISHPTDPNYEMVVPFTNYPKSAEGNILFDMTNPNMHKGIIPYAIPTMLGLGALQENKYGGQWLDEYKEKGEVKSTFNPYANVNRVSSSDGTRVFRLNPEQYNAARQAAAIRNEKIVKGEVKSTFNPYANINRIGTSDNTKVFRLNPEQAENAKKAAAIRNEKIVKEYLQNQQSFIGPDNRTKAEIDKGIALKKEYDRVIAMQNSDLAKTFASFTPGNNIEAGVMGAETFANLNPIISGPILATSRLAPAIMHPTNNAYWGSDRSNLENGLGVLGAIGDITMISPYLKIPLAGIKNPFKNKNFKSEINWANWNKEIPENVPLMQEYNAIEQTTKANGTWMKNFDGSKFKGTPEQFVQQNSKNFKKAYKKGFNTGYRGQRIPTDIMDGGKYPSGITFLGDKDQAMTYGETWKKSHSGKIYQPGMSDPKEPALYELIYPNSNNKKIITHSNVRDWRELTDNDIASQMDEYLLELRGKSKKGEQFITTDDVANFVDKNNLDYAYLPKIRDYGRKPNRRFFNVFPGKSVGNTVVVNSKPGNYLKSRWYNNGMFDMTNPNIYKAVIPTMLGLGALNQKQEGGAIITNRGQWDYPGQTTIIPSNQITMQGVPYPVTGVDNLGNTMVMQPGMNYTFPGQYVTEYPMMQYGGQNTDWEIIG